jgi:hypothetical protein
MTTGRINQVLSEELEADFDPSEQSGDLFSGESSSFSSSTAINPKTDTSNFGQSEDRLKQVISIAFATPNRKQR